MMSKKEKTSKNKKTRFIFGREKSEDGIIRALKKMCKEAGIEFIPSKKSRKGKTKAKK